jgi:hypothetical protein
VTEVTEVTGVDAVDSSNADRSGKTSIQRMYEVASRQTGQSDPNISRSRPERTGGLGESRR